MIELFLLMMMVHGLGLLLLAMPKYNKQVVLFPRKSKKVESHFKYSGALLVSLSVLFAMYAKGMGVGIAWSCALLTFTGTALSVFFSINSNKLITVLFYIPTKIYGELNSRSAVILLSGYFVLMIILII